MKNRYRIYRRLKSGVFYVHDSQTGKQDSLGTRDRAEARLLLNARNESVRQPQLNLQIARTYLAGADEGITTRTWQYAIEALTGTKRGANRERWLRVLKDPALLPLLPNVIIDTQADTLLTALQNGTVSTNVFLRRLHNFCMDMNWLPWPLVPKRQWPSVRFKDKRAITSQEHQRILAGERSTEWQHYYELLWHLGGSQTDIASLVAEDMNWTARTIAYARRKTGSHAVIHFGESVAGVLRSRPATGCLFPQIARWKESDRAKAFIRRCKLMGVSGVSLHSYRYAWAERAKQCGYPERFAQEALGHNSKAVHRAYAKKAQMKLPSLESYEKQAADGRIIRLPSVSPVLPQLPEGRGQKIG